MERFEREINIISLFKNVLKKWRRILVIALAFSALLSLYKLSTIIKRTKPSVLVEEVNDENYINIEEEQKKIESVIYNKNLYFENSIISKMDPTRVATAIVTISITTDDMKKDSNDLGLMSQNLDSGELGSEIAMGTSVRDANRILNFYLRNFEYGMEWGSLTEELDTEAPYLNELISILTVHEELVTADLRIHYLDEAGALKMANQVQKVLQDIHAEAVEIYGPHILEFTNQLVETQAESRYSTWTNDRLVEINNLSTQSNNFANNMKAFSKNEQPVNASKKEIVKDTVKYAVLGFAAGFLISAFVYACLMILRGQVLSAREFNEQFGLTKIAAIPEEHNSLRGIDARIEGIGENYYSSTDIKESWRIANENILYKIGEGKTITVVSDMDSSELESVVNSLNEAKKSDDKQLEYCALVGLNERLSALSKLEESDGVVVVAKTMHSSYNRINELMEVIKSYNKEVIGSIVIG